MKSIFNIAQTTIKGLAAGALLSTALLIPAPEVKAETMWRDSFNHNTLGGSATYNNGDYTQLRNNDINRNSLYESTIQDRDGNLYDCNSLGTCNSRW